MPCDADRTRMLYFGLLVCCGKVFVAGAVMFMCERQTGKSVHREEGSVAVIPE